jgi:hypothetical protein
MVGHKKRDVSRVTLTSSHPEPSAKGVASGEIKERVTREAEMF